MKNFKTYMRKFEEIKFYECGNCGYRMLACEIEAIRCEPLCPRCGKRCVLDFVVVYDEEDESNGKTYLNI